MEEPDRSAPKTATLTLDEWLKLISAAFTGKDGEGEGSVVEGILEKLTKQVQG